jgi:glycosyltransferase 2 family protein
VASRRTRAAATWIGIAVTLVFGYLAIRNADAGEVWDAFGDSNPLWLVPAFGALAAGIFIRAYRWQLLFVPALRPPLRSVWNAVLVGYFFNAVLPARAGELARIVYLNRRARVSHTQAAATVAVERGYDTLILLLLFFAAVPWLPSVSWLRAAALVALLLALALIAAGFVAWRWHGRPLVALLRPLVRRGLLAKERVEAWAHLLGEGLAGLTRPGTMLGVGLWTAVSWLVLSLSNWFVMLGFDLGLSPVAGLLVAVAGAVAMILPASPGALGVFEAATVVALDSYGVPTSQAVSYALVLHALNFVPFVIAGPFAMRGGRLP